MKLRKRIVATLLVALMIFSNVSTLVSADDDLSSLPVEPQVVTEEPVPDLSTALPAVEESELPAENQTPGPAQDEPAPEVTETPDGETAGDPQDEPAEVPEAPQGEDEPAEENDGGFAMPGLFELPGIEVPEDVPETEIVRPESETEEDLNAENGIMPIADGSVPDLSASISPVKTVYEVGDTIQVTFTVSNHRGYSMQHIMLGVSGNIDTSRMQYVSSTRTATNCEPFDWQHYDGKWGVGWQFEYNGFEWEKDKLKGLRDEETLTLTFSYTLTKDDIKDDFKIVTKAANGNGAHERQENAINIKVQKKALTVAIIGNTTIATYDGQDHTASGYTYKVTDSNGTALSNSLVTVAYDNGTPSVTKKDADTYPMGLSRSNFTVTVADSSAYQLKDGTWQVTDGKLTINKAKLTVRYEYKGGSNTKTYDGTPLTVTGKIDGLQNGETATVMFGTETSASRTDFGTSTVTPSIAWGDTNANNYTVEGLVDQTLTVNKRPITVNLKTTEELYVGEGGSNVPVELDGQPEGLVDGHKVELNEGATGTVDTSKAGNPNIEYTATAGVTIKDTADNDVTNNYDITYAGTAEVKPVYTITVTVEGGTAAPADHEITVHAGADQIITFTAEPGNALESATMDGTPIELTRNDANGTYSYTVKGDGNHNINVVFSLDSDGDGTPDKTETNDITVTVTNGTATPAGSPITVAYGQDRTITFTANPGYALDSVTVDDKPAELTNGQYTFENVTKPHSIAVVYAPDNDGDGTPDQKENNKISIDVVGGTSDPKIGMHSATFGEDFTITFAPNPDHILASVTVDGEANTLTGNTFTFTNVTESHSITVVYVLDKNDNKTPDEDEATVTYKVVNGTWSDKTTEDKTEHVVFGHRDEVNGNWVKEDSATLQEIPSGMQANTGYNGGAWLPRVPQTVSKNGDIREFTYIFAQNLDDTVTTSYTVEYYKNGEKVEEDSYTRTSTDWAGYTEHKIAIQTDIDQNPYKYTGYKLDSTDPETIPGVGEEIVSGTTIKLNYVKDTTQTKPLSYTIRYYKDGVWAEDETVTGEVWVNDPDTLPMKAGVADKYAADNYMLESSLPETLPADVENKAEISLYYTKDVNGDGKPDKFQAFIEYTAEANGTILNADTLVKVVDFDAGVSQREVTIEATAEAEDGYALDYWDLDGTPLYDGEYLWNELTVEPGHTYTFTAHFDVDKIGVWDGGPDGTPDKYQITINYAADPVEGGYVEPGNEVVTVSAYQDQRPGEKGHAGVYATAHPYDHYLFDHWTFTDDGPRTIMLMLDGEENPDDEADPLSKAELSYEFDVLGGHSYTLTAHFTRDEDDDGVADKYQATVTYRVVNGTWSDGTTADKTETVTLLDEDGKPAESGSETLKGQSGMIANAGYTGGSWDTVPGSVTAANDGDVYTYTFTAIPPAPTTPDEPAPAAPAPVVPADDGDDDGGDDAIIDENDTPLGGNPNNGYDLNANGGNGTGSEAGGVTIEDDDTPLAGGPLEEDCCILHLLIMLVALAVAVYYTHNRKQHQARQFELRSRM